MNNTLTDVSGIRVGHATNLEVATGCTVILCPQGTVGGVDQRGGAPGTRETDLLRPVHLVEEVNAIVLSGGSAYGLATADGVMSYLEENNTGYSSVGGYVVPIVPTAILMDLPIGRPDVRPDAAMGYAACQAATTDPVAQGTVGAGTGCRIGPMMGNELATKGGLGSASMFIDDDLIVGALVAVNSGGDVVDENGATIAGVRRVDGQGFAGALNIMRSMARVTDISPSRDNTVIGVVATNAKLSREQVTKVAQMAQNGIARVIRPAHTMYDGDTVFSLATGEIEANVTVVGAFAAEVMAQAIRSAVQHATSLFDVRAAAD